MLSPGVGASALSTPWAETEEENFELDAKDKVISNRARHFDFPFISNFNRIGK